MGLWAHHLAVELYGKEYSPETPMEHVVVFGVTGLALGLMIYGACAVVRDLLRWRRQRQTTTR
jgi:hypothetical protein